MTLKLLQDAESKLNDLVKTRTLQFVQEVYEIINESFMKTIGVMDLTGGRIAKHLPMRIKLICISTSSQRNERKRNKVPIPYIETLRKIYFFHPRVHVIGSKNE